METLAFPVTRSETECFYGGHPLICSCGDALKIVPAGDEWAYASLETGKTLEHTPNPILAKYGWNGLAERDIGLYSIMSSWVASRGSVDTYHSHLPQECPEPHEEARSLPECCETPMRYSPQAWVCRVRDHSQPEPRVRVRRGRK